jgi:protein ImuB
LGESTTPPDAPLEAAEVEPLVTALHDGRRRVIAAADPVAAGLGLRPGMAVAQALAVVPGLQVMEAEPKADADALQRLARWCHRVTPLAAADAPDGLWLDITGCAHLFDDETALLESLVSRFARDGFHARAAVAGTPGAAHALARHAASAMPVVVPPGEQGAAMAALPVGALRVPPELEATLRRLGFERVGHLARIPRALLARRFGPLPGLRLDHAHGQVHEPLTFLPPEQALQRRECFLEPLSTAEALAMAISLLMGPLCTEMEQLGLGARQLDLLFERIDSQVVSVRIGTARATRDARHLARLLVERLGTVDPGLGVEAMRLVATLAEPLRWEQQGDGASPQDVARLVDRLANRLGPERVYRAGAVESVIPERSVCKQDAAMATQPAASIGPMAVPAVIPALPGGHRPIPWRKPPPRRVMGPAAHGWPSQLPRPARLLEPPRPIEALAALPDQPPVAFTWRRHRHRVRRAEGPERIHAEWWRGDPEQAVRDYFRVEDETGRRFWLFRNGNGIDPATGDLAWFLHGLF